jgi:dolichyl-diphosphooligosaccharide--protein glycosyltransferase
MNLAREKTPPGSLIWTWWDHGYPMLYYSRRGTISDGAFHDGELAMINAFPMATKSYRQSANWMHFYAAQGVNGFHYVYRQLGGTAEGWEFIRKVLEVGPEEAAKIIEARGLEPKSRWLSFFYPPLEQRRKVFLFLDERLVGTSYWWYWLGTWSIEEKEGQRPFLNFFVQIRQEMDRIVGKPPFSLDLKQGVFSTNKQVIPLSVVVFREGDEWKAAQYRDFGMIFEHDLVTSWGALLSPEIYDSTFNQLFFLVTADTRYFRPIFLSNGVCQLWEVTGDLLPVAPAP